MRDPRSLRPIASVVDRKAILFVSPLAIPPQFVPSASIQASALYMLPRRPLFVPDPLAGAIPSSEGVLAWERCAQVETSYGQKPRFQVAMV